MPETVPGTTERIDAHQHFWEVESGRYAWPTPADGILYRTFAPEDLEPELRDARMDRTVLVQTVNTLDDTDSMLAAGRRHAFIAAVVGWVPLLDVRATELELDARPDRSLRGIRHLIHFEPDPNWILRDELTPSLRLLAERGLSYDVVAVFPDHLRHVPVLADRHPDLRLVVDHLANPPFRSPGWSVWQEQLGAAAERPNVVAKISGLVTDAGPGWTSDELGPAVDIALEAFGPERLMFGSDWPVCRAQSTYRDVVAAVELLIARLSRPEREAILGGTAASVYRIDPTFAADPA